MTTALILNAVLSVAIAGALASAVRLALRMRGEQSVETLHPSQPIPLSVAHEDRADRDLARAA